MEHLSEDEVAEFREIFNLVDRDGGGSITASELGELMDTLGIDASPEEIEAMIKEIDQDGDGDIDFEEFVAVMSRKVTQRTRVIKSRAPSVSLSPTRHKAMSARRTSSVPCVRMGWRSSRRSRPVT